MSEYSDFLASKLIVAPSAGSEVKPEDIHPSLFPFQRDLVRWSLRKGRGALFADTGLGKTRMQLEYGRLTGGRLLILAPLAVAQQTIDEARALDTLELKYARNQDEASKWTITNYERLDRFDPQAFDTVVLDECFPAGTSVDTPLGVKNIEDFRIGDEVKSAVGADTVWDVHRREVKYAVAVRVAGRSIVCSPNHPWFTQRGWVGAQDLEPGDSLVSTAEAVSMVRGAFRQEVGQPTTRESFLRPVLLSEMADEPAKVSSEVAHTRGSRETREEQERLASLGIAGGGSAVDSYSGVEPHEGPGSASQGLPPIEGHEPQTFRAWGQWDGYDLSAVDDAGCSWRAVAGRVMYLTGPADSWISDALQARFRQCRAAGRYRSGWELPLLTKGQGREEGCQTGFTRVDGLEVLEPRDSRLDQLRDADGKLYFYDLGVTGHPSFSVGGYLVHNSSILKSADAKTRTALIKTFPGMRWRLCCTATPAPNDTAELGNHSEFLGTLSRAEMLATFFVHDNRRWLLKGHARRPFYRWLASWGMTIRKPSDLGYSDDGFALPPLSIEPVIVESDWAPDGQLFSAGLSGITGRLEVRQATLDARVAATERLVRSEPSEQWLLWCGLNDESDALARAIPEAVVVRGSDSPEEKAERLLAFAAGQIRVLVTKPQIAGFGMNFQRCARMAFVGIGDSFETYYQAIRRCWRFGQKRPVRACIVLSEPEQEVYRNVLRKEEEAREVAAELLRDVAEYERAELRPEGGDDAYTGREKVRVPSWL